VSWLNEQVPSSGALRPGSGRPEPRRGAALAPDAARGPRWASADGAECARSPPPLRSARSAGSAHHPSIALGMALSKVEGPQRGQARTSRPNVRRIKSAKRRASSRGGRRSRSQAGSGAGSVALASRGATRTPAVGASVVRTSLESARSSAVDASAVLASPRLAVFPKPTTSDRHPSTLLGMALSRTEGPRGPRPQHSPSRRDTGCHLDAASARLAAA